MSASRSLQMLPGRNQVCALECKKCEENTPCGMPRGVLQCNQQITQCYISLLYYTQRRRPQCRTTQGCASPATAASPWTMSWTGTMCPLRTRRPSYGTSSGTSSGRGARILRGPRPLGLHLEQREGYQAMRRELMAHRLDILVIKDFSRFSRRNSRGLVELEDLRDAGVRIISIGRRNRLPGTTTTGSRSSSSS